jgi:hypothetical protein
VGAQDVKAHARLTPFHGMIARHARAVSSAMINRGKEQKWAARGQRLSAALRENLKRRKAQARGRAADAAPDQAAPALDASSDPAAPDFRRNPGWKSDPDGRGTKR